MASETRTGGRAATDAVIQGRHALSVGKPSTTPITGWEWTPLTKLARLESGHTPSRKRAEWWGGDIPWIGIRDATQNHGRVIPDTLQHTNDEGIANSSARLLPAHTVCLSRTASVGYVVVMGRPMATSQDFVNWVCDPDLLDWRFLRWVLVGEGDSFLRFASGTTHQTIYFPEVKAFHICLPPLAEQKRIASVLGALDDDALHLRWLAGRLEEMLGLLYHRLAQSEPWPVKALGDQVEIVMGQSPPGSSYGDAAGGGLPIVQGMGAFGRRFPDLTMWTSSPSKQAMAGDVLMTVRAPVGEVNICRAQLCAGRGVAAIRSPHPAYAEQLVRSLRSSWAAQESGTIFPAVNKTQIESMPVPCPNDDAIDAFEQVARPLYELVAELESNADRLIELRNTLLPKLISGKLRVAEDYFADLDEPVAV